MEETSPLELSDISALEHPDNLTVTHECVPILDPIHYIIAECTNFCKELASRTHLMLQPDRRKSV